MQMHNSFVLLFLVAEPVVSWANSLSSLAIFLQKKTYLLKQRFQFDRDLLVVYDPQEKTFWDPHLFILFSSTSPTVTSTDESKEVTSSTERISFSREGLHVNFQGAAVGLEHECVKCTSQTIQRVSLACISWQVLGDDTRAELEERQAVRETVLLPSTPAVWHERI